MIANGFLIGSIVLNVFAFLVNVAVVLLTLRTRRTLQQIERLRLQRQATLDEGEYHVAWDIHVSAPTARAAAIEAWQVQRDRESTATIFTVQGKHGPAETYDIGK